MACDTVAVLYYMYYNAALLVRIILDNDTS